MSVLAVALDDITVDFLRAHGFVVEIQEIEDAAELEDWIKDGLYSAAIFDLEKSGLGIYTARGPREKDMQTSLIGISCGSENRVWGDHRALFLENGGDDLLRGPVNPRELVASLRATTRRFKGSLLDIVEYTHNGAKLKINLTTKAVFLNDSRVHLTGKELDALLLLASGPNRTFSKEAILNHLYTPGIDDEPEMKIIDVFVCKIRKKLVAMHPDAEQFIKTDWGKGYCLMRQPERTSREVA